LIGFNDNRWSPARRRHLK